MTQKTFLVTGATGNTGRYTTALLLERGHRVRALAHHEDTRSEALKQQGAELIRGDLLDFTACNEHCRAWTARTLLSAAAWYCASDSVLRPSG